MRKREGIIVRNIGDASVLVPTGRQVVDLSCLVVLNKTGRFLWDLLEGDCSLEDLAGALVRHFGISQQTAMSDTADFVDELEKMDMLENAGNAS